MKTVKLNDFFNESQLNLSIEIDAFGFTAKISGDISQINFPPISSESARKNELWTIGCFEIFVSGENNSYTEYNFGFDGNWECFNFSDYRENQSRPKVDNPPEVVCEISHNLFTQKVSFKKDIISKNSFSLSAVIKLKNKEFLYFANKHCAKTADFHIKEARSLSF